MLSVSDKVRASFGSILQALPKARQVLLAQADVITVRPGYSYGTAKSATPAVVVAVMPGTTPVNANSLEKQFGVPFTVTDATIEEQVAAAKAKGGAVSFGLKDVSGQPSFEKLLTGDETLEPKSGGWRL